jgi:NADH:ubiquinone oxidoreductase subunit K
VLSTVLLLLAWFGVVWCSNLVFILVNVNVILFHFHACIHHSYHMLLHDDECYLITRVSIK